MIRTSIYAILVKQLYSQCEFCDVFSAFSDPNFNENTMSKSLHEGIVEFKEAMLRSGYTEEAIVWELNLKPNIGLNAQSLYDRIPVYSHPTPLQTLIYLFLSFNIWVGSGIPVETVENVLGLKAVKALVELGVLVEIDDKYHSTVLLTPLDTDPSMGKHREGYQGLFIATDFKVPYGDVEWRELYEPVMPLGYDTKALAYGAPRTRRVRRVLDLCTGSGVQALLAINYYADDVTLVDLNPRAVRFSRFNLLLNGISSKQSRVYLGDLYKALGSEDRIFDVILANPPYVPGFLDTNALYGAGGLKGDTITMAVVQGAGHWLTSDGVLRIVASTFNNHEYEARLKRWWGKGDAEISFYNANLWDNERIKKMSADWAAHFENGSNTLIWIQRRPNIESATFCQTKLHHDMWKVLYSRSIDKVLVLYLLSVEDTSKLLPDYSIFIEADGSQHHVFREVWLWCGAAFNPTHYYPENLFQLHQIPENELQELLDCVFNHDKLVQGVKGEEDCTGEAQENCAYKS